MPDFESSNYDQITHVVLLIDESGSMFPSREAVVTTVNDYVQGLKGKISGQSRVTIVKFDSEGWNELTKVRVVKVFDNVPLSEVREFKLADYRPNGGTPLHDAIGKTVNAVTDFVKSNPGPVFFSILTDGAENSSREFKLNAIRALIEERTEAGWTFNFMGVDINAYHDGAKFGASVYNTVSIKRGKLDALATSLVNSTVEGVALYGSSATVSEYASRNKLRASFKSADKANLEND